KADWVFPKGNGNFQPAKFLNFGKGYTGLPGWLAGYVYLSGPKQESAPKSIYLSRAPRDQVRERTSYEFFIGSESDHKAKWTSDFAQAQPVFYDTNGVTPASVTYNPAIQRFLLTTYHRGPGQLGVFEAPRPWGPWTTVAYYENWGGMGTAGEG